MDKKAQNLDPQLKAAYDRVMGTNIPTQTASPSINSDAPQPTTVSAPAPQVAQPTVGAHPSGGPGVSGATTVVAGGGKSGRVSPILVVVALILFFVVYTFVCLMLFGVKIPFLNP